MVHGLAHILEHAPEGHEEVPMLVACVTAATVKNAGGEGAALLRETSPKIYPLSDPIPSPHPPPPSYLTYLEQLVKKSTRQA